MVESTTTTETARPVLSTADAPGRRNLRPPWQKGVSGNPSGRRPYRRLFEETLARAVEENAEALVAKLVQMAMDGDARMMAVLVDRLVPKIQRHEIDGAEAPAKLVIEFAKPELPAA